MFLEESSVAWMPHIALAEEAELLLISPATANITGKLASVIADDLLSCVVLASKAKKIIVPAMNTGMFENSIVRQNCEKLRQHGFYFVEPEEGLLACGTFGRGHIASEESILHKVKEVLGA